MIFDMPRWLALAIVGEEADLIEPNAGQDEGPIATFTSDLTLLQVSGLHDALEEQFDRLLAVVIKVILPGPTCFRRLLG
jgi:hypothetical protein